MKKTIIPGLIILQAIVSSCCAESWEIPLRNALKTCNEIRVRSGGTCHRDKDDEKLLFKVSGAPEVERAVQSIEIDEERSGFHCMCCGDPTIEFYYDNILLVSLAYHHGQSLRWYKGEWEGDALLTPESMEAIAQWMSDNGITEPLEELRLNQERERAAMNRFRKYSAIIPEVLEELWDMARTEDDMVTALDQVITNETERVVLLFKLYGCDFGAWNANNSLDDFLVSRLNTIDSSTLWDAVRQSLGNEQAKRGAARWIIIEHKAEEDIDEMLMPVLPDLAAVGLTHPRRICRERTVAYLEKHPGEKSTELLIKCLKGEFTVKPLPPDEEVEPGGMVVFWPRDASLTDECSERAYAALVLARSGEESIRPIVKELIDDAPGNDKEVYETAIALLDEKGTKSSE